MGIEEEVMFEKSIENIKFQNRKTRTKFNQMMNKMSKDTYVSLFWLVFHHFYTHRSWEGARDALEKQLNSRYAAFYLSLTQVEKDNKLHLVPFLLSDWVIKIFFKIFRTSRSSFTDEFGIKVLKLVFFKLQVRN